MQNILLITTVLLTMAGVTALADPPQYTLQFLGEGIKVEGMNENGLETRGIPCHIVVAKEKTPFKVGRVS